MPPRRSAHVVSEDKPQRKPSIEPVSVSVTDKTSSFIQSVKSFITDERTHYVAGLILLGIAVYIGFACISYFFTGIDDYNFIHSKESLIEQSKDIKFHYHNWTGPLGSRIADFLIDGCFGWSIFFAIYALFIIALKMMRAPVPSVVRTIGHCSFWMIWTSIAIGFVFRNVYSTSSFYRWGGKHGLMVSDWLVSYIQYTGTIIVLLSALIIYLIIVDERTVPRLKAFGRFLHNLFFRKPKPEPATAEHTESETEVTIHIENQDGSDTESEEQNSDNEENETDNSLINEHDNSDDNNSNNEDYTDEDTIIQPEIQTDDSADNNSEFIITNQGDAAELTVEDESDESENKDEEGVDLNIVDTPAEELTEQDAYKKMMEELGPFDPRKDLEYYQFPPFDGKTEEERILKVYPNENAPVINMEEQEANKNKIINTLRSYGVEITRISATIGPTVTLYEIVPKEGTRINKIKNLENDIMLSLAAMGIRIIAPIPGKGTIGIEVPNEKPQIVSMHSVIASRKFQEEKKMALPVVLGKTITNEVFMFDLAKTPHLLVAGATGQGKSVGLNAIITSLLYKKHPAELKFVLVDPKMVEFSIYKSIEKNYIAETPDQEDPIITDCEKVKNILNSLVIEMENRYTKLMEANCRNIIEYNDKVVNRRLSSDNYLPYLVIIIDEFGDFIMQAGKEVEMPIARIAQKARAVGMHMILATQRPSANVITGIIKANVPARIAFRVGSQIDSRVILDTKGAEQLIGKGDLLYSAGQEPIRIQCAFVDTPEVEKLVNHISHQQSYNMSYQLPEYVPEGEEGEALKPGEVDLHKLDPLFKEVATYVVLNQQGSTSVLQRKFGIGYNRAGKLSDQLEAAGIVGPNKGPKGRDVLIMDEMSLAQKLRELGVE